MYLFREVLYCRPGKVRPLVDKFKALGAVMQSMGYEPFRIYTDVSGERFWTLVLESESASLDASREMETSVMGNPDAQQIMAGYHDLVTEGRREIYAVEA
jgi:hypothetical protein